MIRKNSLELSNEVRLKTLEMVYHAKTSHIGGALSMVDILAVLYTDILHIDPVNPLWPSRDRFFLSKGHACTSLYVTLGLKGFYALDQLNTFAKNGSIFLSHTSHKVPGVEVSAGSLGHALPIAAGVALAGKRKNQIWKVFCLLSDGELDEGSNWETFLFAPQHKLDNLIAIIDYNKIQSFGFVSEVLNLEPLKAKFDAFGWNVLEVDGHDHKQIKEAFKFSTVSVGKPTVIIAHTIKGKGIDFMENKLIWHYKPPTDEEFQDAYKRLK